MNSMSKQLDSNVLYWTSGKKNRSWKFFVTIKCLQLHETTWRNALMLNQIIETFSIQFDRHSNGMSIFDFNYT